MTDDAISELIPLVGKVKALAAMGVKRATWYRRHRQSPEPARPERIVTPAAPGAVSGRT